MATHGGVTPQPSGIIASGIRGIGGTAKSSISPRRTFAGFCQQKDIHQTKLKITYDTYDTYDIILKILRILWHRKTKERWQAMTLIPQNNGRGFDSCSVPPPIFVVMGPHHKSAGLNFKKKIWGSLCPWDHNWLVYPRLVRTPRPGGHPLPPGD